MLPVTLRSRRWSAWTARLVHAPRWGSLARSRVRKALSRASPSARTCDGLFSRFSDSSLSTLLVKFAAILWLHCCLDGRAAEIIVANHPPKEWRKTALFRLATDWGNPAGARWSNGDFRHSPGDL